MPTTIEKVDIPTFKLPDVLKPIDPDILRGLFLDLKVEISPKPMVASCHCVTLTVSLLPGLFPKPGTGTKLPVDIRITDPSLPRGNPYRVQDITLHLPADGSVVRVGYEWPMPSDAKFTPDFHNDLLIEIDPDHIYIERNELNNQVQFTGTCIG